MSTNLAVDILPSGNIDIGAALRLLADRLRDLVCYVDRDEVVRYVNRTGASWWAYTPDQAVGGSLERLLGEHYARLRPLYTRALGGEPIAIERSVDYPDGQHRDVFLTLTPHQDEDGTILGVLVISEDRSSLADARTEIRQQRTLTDQALANLAQGLLVFDSAYKLRLWNEQAYTLRGYARDFLREGMSYREVLEHNLSQGVFGDVQGSFLDAALTPEAMSIPFRLQFTLESGKTVDMQRTPLPDGGFVLTYTDVTEAKHAEAFLRDNERRFRSIVQRLPVPATIVRVADGKVLFRNPEAEKLLADYRARGVFSTDDEIRKMWARNLKQWLALPGEGGFRQREFPVTIEGKRLWYLAAGQRIEHDGDACLFVSWIDITDMKAAQEALAQSEANLAEAQRIGHFGSWQHDLSKREAVWSAHYFDLLGLPRDAESVYETILNLVHPADREGFDEVFQTAKSGSDAGECEFRIVRPDGEIRHMRSIFHFDRDDKGRPVRVAGTSQDITDLRAAQAALQESEARLRQASSLASLGHWVWDAHTDRCLFCSEENAQIHGLSVEAYMREAATLDQEFTLVHPEDRKRIKSLYVQLRQGEPFEAQYRIVTPAGDVRHLREIAMPVFDDQGQVVEEYGVAQDITPLLETERALAASEARFRSVVNQSPTGFVLTDTTGRVQLVNQACQDWFGIEDDTAIGQRLIDLVPSDLTARIDDLVAAVLRDGLPQEIEIALAGDAAPSRILMCSMFPIRDADGSITGIGHLATDVTSQRQTEERLRHSQKMEAVGHMTGGVAHDFNNLLTAVIGNLDLLGLQADEKEDDESRRLIDTAIRAAQRGGRLTQQLLAFSRKQVLDPVPTDLNETVRDVLPLARTGTRAPIHIATDLADDLLRISVDRGQLENALLNLVFNARDALASGGTITISTANAKPVAKDLVGAPEEIAPGDYVMIAVADDGAGMSASTRAQAVEPFFTTKPVGQGSGLGLSMVFGFVKQSGGHLAIVSAPGAGTTVRLYLPANKATPPAQARDEQDDSFERARGDECILVVEDDADIRKFITSVLQRLGYDVLQAEDGETALWLMQSREVIDLLLTDVILPGSTDGHEVARNFRTCFADGRVLFTTGNVGAGPTPDGPVLNKPYRIDTLAQRIRETLEAPES